MPLITGTSIARRQRKRAEKRRAALLAQRRADRDQAEQRAAGMRTTEARTETR